MKSTERAFDGPLVLRCLNGDKKAYSQLVKRWHQKFCKQAHWYTKDIDLAKDIAQESWTVIFEKLDTLNEPNSFASWALSIVNRKSIDAMRKVNRSDKKLRNYYEDLKGNDEQQTTNKTIADDDTDTTINYSKIVMRAINRLPENQQVVLRFFYVEEYSVSEISGVLKVSNGTVKSRLFYAREKLKLILKQHKNEKS